MMSTRSVIQRLVAWPGGHEPQPSTPFAGSPASATIKHQAVLHNRRHQHNRTQWASPMTGFACPHHDSRVAVGALRFAYPTGCFEIVSSWFSGSDPWGKVAADAL